MEALSMILVMGATGNVGRELVGQLLKRGEAVRVLARDATRVRDGVECVVGDLGDASAVAAAVEGVDRIFLLVPGTGLEHTAIVIAAARAARVRHIVLLSSFHVVGEPVQAMGRWHRAREEAIVAAGLDATFLRPGAFMTNALVWVPAIRIGEPILDPLGPGRYAPIDPADIAAVATLVLTGDGHSGAAYLLTGEEVLTVGEQVGILAGVLGRPILVRAATTPDEVVRSRFPRGAPPALADALVESLTRARADTVGVRTDTVARLLRRSPRTFADWCQRNAAAFA
jgi:uncharacterized protein YbjT (DUF2867 family)